ncbi:hypothetical protein H4R19_000187 [Coemansia spiralis]|nr:hypothetical protein H4R19_000187 [Coemansia spiralis]
MERRGATTAAADPRVFGDRLGFGTLGLDIATGRRFMGTLMADESHSPTVPDHLFTDDVPPSQLVAHANGLPTPTKAPGAYTLNPDFVRAQDAKTPPVPHLPALYAGSFPPQAPQPITFPRPDDEARPLDDTADRAPPQGTRTPGHASPEPNGRAARQAGGAREPSLFPKRNYSLPAALAPQTPKLQLEGYEFTSIESLERKWANVKTESTRMLSSAIYKYYFSQGEWTEFEQVFPGRVLEAWEDFRNKLSPSELAFINTVLVSQNPFSSGQGGQKHIPILARTIPLAQVVRTMVFSEDMRSRESHTSQSSNGAEVEAEFADWLITRFNAKKPGSTLSPSEPTFDEPRAKAPLPTTAAAAAAAPDAPPRSRQERAPDAPSRSRSPEPKQPPPQRLGVPKSAPPTPAAHPTAVPRPAERPSIDRGPAVRERIVHEPVGQYPARAKQAEKSRAQYEFPPQEPAVPAHKSLGLGDAAPSRELRPRSAMTFSGTADAGAAAPPPADEALAAGDTKTRRKFTFGSRSELRPSTPAATHTRRPSITMPTIFQSWRKGSRADAPPPADVLAAPYEHDVNLPPPSPPAQGERPTTAGSTGSRARRHTHNFFSSRPVETRPPSEVGRTGRRLTREVQMKDLPPLPPNAAEITQLARLIETDVRIKATQSASMLRKQPGVLAHFSSHAELGPRMAAVLDKPRTSSMADAADKGRRRPSVATLSNGHVPTTPGSRPRESGSTEITRAVFDWRPAPPSGDASWGFVVSPLAYREPMARKQSNAVQLVVHSHTPTMNRRNLPPPEGTQPKVTPRRGREARLQAAKEARPSVDGAEAKQRAASDAPKPDPAVAAAADGGKAVEAAPPAQTAAAEPAVPAVDKAPELPKATMPQDEPKSRPVPASGVRGVLYELAYLSTQGKNVWSKSEHIFSHMAETGLEVNRIAEQDFFDYCVDELLKASNDASHDLHSMGNKKVAKKLYESFNAKLSILLAGSAL